MGRDTVASNRNSNIFTATKSNDSNNSGLPPRSSPSVFSTAAPRRASSANRVLQALRTSAFQGVVVDEDFNDGNGRRTSHLVTPSEKLPTQERRCTRARWTPHRDNAPPPELRSSLGLDSIFRGRGSIYLVVLPRCLFSAFIVIVLKYQSWVDVSSIMESHFAYETWTYVLGFTIIFRINMSYGRWWSARMAVERMSSRWFDVAVMACTFDEYSQVSEQRRLAFRLQVTGLISLLHSMAMMELSQDIAVPSLCNHLNETYLGKFNTVKDGTAQTSIWLIMLITGRFNKHTVQSPICSRMYANLGNGLEAFHQAVAIKTTPFPFSFIQIVQVGLLVFVVTLPLVMHHWVQSPFWCVIFTIGAVFGFASLAEAGMELDQPFGNDANNHPLQSFQEDFDRELFALARGGVSYAPPSPDEELLKQMIQYAQLDEPLCMEHSWSNAAAKTMKNKGPMSSCQLHDPKTLRSMLNGGAKLMTQEISFIYHEDWDSGPADFAFTPRGPQGSVGMGAFLQKKLHHQNSDELSSACSSQSLSGSLSRGAAHSWNAGKVAAEHRSKQIDTVGEDSAEDSAEDISQIGSAEDIGAPSQAKTVSASQPLVPASKLFVEESEVERVASCSAGSETPIPPKSLE